MDYPCGKFGDLVVLAVLVLSCGQTDTHSDRRIVSEMTYNVSMGTLNPTIPMTDVDERFTLNE